MPRFVTFITYDDEDPQVMTEEEYRATSAPDWSEWVWQFAPDKATALTQHFLKMDAFEADCAASRPIPATY